MNTFPEMVERFLNEALATCPPDYELDEMHVEGLIGPSNETTLVVTWRPISDARR